MPTKNNLARARTELSAYAIAVQPDYDLAPHVRCLISELERVERGECDRLLIAMPPRHGKTRTASVIFPSWYLGKHPDKSVISVTYGQELSNDLGRQARALVGGELHHMIFPQSSIVPGDEAMHRFGLSRGGRYFSIGSGGTLTGRGGNLVIVDDAVKDAESAYSTTSRASLQSWFEMVLYPRLQPGGAIIVIGTRWHESDLSGWILREHAADGWAVVSLPAIAEPGDALGRAEGQPLWPSKFPLEALMRIREAIGSSAFASLYQQRPVAAEGAIFRKDWLCTYVDPPELFRTIFSLDCAFKTGSSNDYSVIAVWGEGKSGYFLLDVVRERLDFPALMSRTIAKASFWNPHAVLIEDAASGQSLIQTLQLETRLPLLAVKPLGDKESRASAVSPLFESGRVFIPQQAHWLSEFVDELTSFPASPHDDMVDATTQALSWLRGQNHTYGGDIHIPRGSTTSPGGLQIRNGEYVYPIADTCAERDLMDDAGGGGSRAAGVISVFGSQRFRGRGTW